MMVTLAASQTASFIISGIKKAPGGFLVLTLELIEKVLYFGGGMPAAFCKLIKSLLHFFIIGCLCKALIIPNLFLFIKHCFLQKGFDFHAFTSRNNNVSLPLINMYNVNK